jgi:hypothetical protein
MPSFTATKTIVATSATTQTNQFGLEMLALTLMCESQGPTSGACRELWKRTQHNSKSRY